MKKIHTSIILWLLLCNFCIAQSGSFFIESNYNQFKHSSLKSFQQELINNVPEIPFQMNENFSADNSFTIGYTMLDKEIAVFFSYNNTIGMFSYNDAFSEFKITTPLKGYTFGASHLFKVIPEYDKLHIGLRVFATFSSLDIHSYSKTLASIQTTSVGYKSIDAGLGLNLIYEYPVYYFNIRAFIGYDFVLGRQMTLNGDNRYYLENKNKQEVNTGWSGLRTGIGISIPVFPFVKKK